MSRRLRQLHQVALATPYALFVFAEAVAEGGRVIAAAVREAGA